MIYINEELNKRFLLQTEYLGDEKQINKIVPIVSVSVITYQHVNYIQQCLNGILMQKTSFPFEIIIGEDGSTDGTQEICKKYAEENPDKIRLFIRDRNLSQYITSEGKTVRFNGIWNRMSTRGKYIALCEGDDYWTDPVKLQKQVDFLEANPDYGLVHTDCLFFFQSKNLLEHTNYINDKNKFIDLIYRNSIGTLTTCFSKKAYNMYVNEINPYEKNWMMGDYPMWLWFSKKTKIKFLDEITATYRILEESISHSKDVQKRYKFICGDWDVRLFFGERYLSKEEYNILYHKYIKIFYKLAFLFKDKNKQIEVLDYYKVKNKKIFFFFTFFYWLNNFSFFKINRIIALRLMK